MGTLRDPDTGVLVTLSARHRVGRAQDVDLRLEDARVSGDHALVRWEFGSWVVQDLSSTNGVFVDGTRVTPGVPTPLEEGARLGFGREENGWELVETSPPSAWAVAADGARRSQIAGRLSLPDDAHPRVVVKSNPEHGWTALDSGGERAVRDGEELFDGVQVWRLHLPELLARTVRNHASLVPASACTLRFAASQDREHISIEVQVDGERRPLGERVYGDLLLRLAERRQHDAADGVAETECGWVSRAKLADEHRIPISQLNLWMHRFRQQLSAAGVQDPQRAFDLRDRGRVLRLALAADAR